MCGKHCLKVFTVCSTTSINRFAQFFFYPQSLITLFSVLRDLFQTLTSRHFNLSTDSQLTFWLIHLCQRSGSTLQILEINISVRRPHEINEQCNQKSWLCPTLHSSSSRKGFGVWVVRLHGENLDLDPNGCLDLDTLHERIQDFSQQKEEEIHLLAHLKLKLELVTTFRNNIFSYTCRPEQTVGVRTR